MITAMATSVSLFVSLNEKKRKIGTAISPRDKASWRKLKCMLEQMICGRDRRPEADLRESLRIPTQLNVQFEHRGIYGSGTITEIGDGGCFVRTSMPMVRGSMIHMTLVTSSLSTCRVQGEVVWTSTASPTRYGMGIRFHLHSAEQKADLYRLVDYCLFQVEIPDAPAPARLTSSSLPG